MALKFLMGMREAYQKFCCEKNFSYDFVGTILVLSASAERPEN